MQNSQTSIIELSSVALFTQTSIIELSSVALFTQTSVIELSSVTLSTIYIDEEQTSVIHFPP